MRTVPPTRPRLLVACALVGLAVLTPARAADPPRSDAHGDPLPEGALARLGTVRWRAGSAIALTAFLPDGKSVLTVTQDHVAQVWERDTGQELRHFDAAGPSPVNGPRAVLSSATTGNVLLSADGKLLACAGRDGAVRLWDVATGKETAKIGDARAVVRSQIALSGDGKTLATSAYGQQTTLWDTATGKELRSFGETNGNVRLMAYRSALSHDGKTLVQTGMEVGNGAIKTAIVVWDAVKGKELHRITDPVAGGSLPALASALTPDAKLLAMPLGAKVKLFDLTTGKVARELDGPPGQGSLAFSPDGQRLVCLVGHNQSLTVWDVATGKAVHQFGKAEAPAAPAAWAGAVRVAYGLSVSPDGKWLAWGDGPAVRLIDLETGKEKNAAGHAASPRDLRFARDGKTLLTWGDDATVRRWDGATGKEIGQVAVPGKSFAFLIPSPDERVLAAGEADGTIRLYAAASAKEQHAFTPAQPIFSYNRSVAFSPDSRFLAAASMYSPTVDIYDVRNGREKHALALPVEQQPTAPGGRLIVRGRMAHQVFFSPDSRLVAATDVNLILWDVASGREERQLVLPPGTVVRYATFSPDGRTIAVEAADGEVGLWEVASGQKRLTLNPQAKADTARPITAIARITVAGLASPVTLAFSPDGRLLAQANDRRARLWDLYAGKEVATYEGHRGPVAALAFAADGKRLATVSGDTTGLLWDAEPALKKLAPLPAATLPKEKLAALWDTLGESDGPRAYDAICALAGDPAQAVPFLGERVKPVIAPDAKQVDKLIADLDADAFEVRAKAHKELEQYGELARAPMRAALKGRPSAEQRRSLEELLASIGDRAPSGERVRLVRALEVLERAGTADAVKVLKGIAAGAPDTFTTTQAQVILARLGQK